MLILLCSSINSISKSLLYILALGLPYLLDVGDFNSLRETGQWLHYSSLLPFPTNEYSQNKVVYFGNSVYEINLVVCCYLACSPLKSFVCFVIFCRFVHFLSIRALFIFSNSNFPKVFSVVRFRPL